jgi:hypothetical protein
MREVDPEAGGLGPALRALAAPLRSRAHAIVTRAQLRLVWPLPSKAAYLAALLRGGRRGTALFLPNVPNSHHVLYRVLHRQGWRITGDPDALCDLAIAWRTLSEAEPEAIRRRVGEGTRILNLTATDISKARVDEAAAQAMGHDVRIDPLTHVGPCVRKSNSNALHDGVIVTCPLPSVDPSFVYQRVVDNTVEDGLVEDLRLPVVGNLIPFVYRKYRPAARRFANENSRVAIDRTNAAISENEARGILAFCRLLGLDYVEIDALRDRRDGRLYIVDANPTPYGPPNHLPGREGRRAMAMLGQAFVTAFGGGRSES